MNSHTHLVLSLFLLLTSLAHTQADLYGNPSPPKAMGPAPPPPFDVAGKNFPRQSFQCDNISSRCAGKEIQCPAECPEFKPADPNAKGCFVDCSSPKCEAVCRNRKPNCDGIGAACFDPRFVGGDGIIFYFHGKANHYFTLVSDSNIHINARFIGRRPEGRSRDYTWIQALGLRFESHTFTLHAADKVASWNHRHDHLLFTYDGTPILLDLGHLSVWAAPDSPLTVERTAAVNSVTVTLPQVAEISANVVPITEEDDRIHRYGIPEDDCFAHLEVQFRFFNLSERVEGVLGQTYRPEYESPVKTGVLMPIMGGEDKYQTTTLLSPDCKLCIFAPAELPAKPLMLERTATMDCTSKLSSGRGLVCRR